MPVLATAKLYTSYMETSNWLLFKSLKLAKVLLLNSKKKLLKYLLPVNTCWPAKVATVESIDKVPVVVIVPPVSPVPVATEVTPLPLGRFPVW